MSANGRIAVGFGAAVVCYFALDAGLGATTWGRAAGMLAVATGCLAVMLWVLVTVLRDPGPRR